MSYICTGRLGSTTPVICHCQLVPGFGCHTVATVDGAFVLVGAVAVGAGYVAVDVLADVEGSGAAVGDATGEAGVWVVGGTWTGGIVRL
jgi:hypothetical protein